MRSSGTCPRLRKGFPRFFPGVCGRVRHYNQQRALVDCMKRIGFGQWITQANDCRGQKRTIKEWNEKPSK
jgi:hypothetical protein